MAAEAHVDNGTATSNGACRRKEVLAMPSNEVLGSVVFKSAALDECASGIILRGVIDHPSMRCIQVGPYQREQLVGPSRRQLIKALHEGTLPDVELGMRGDNFDEVDGKVILLNPVFVIDGLQRISAALELMERCPEHPPRIGGVVHFNTTESWERERFRILNLDRIRLSPNVLMRNWSEDYPVIAALLQLTQDRGFVLYGLVSWNQRMRQTELISATTYAKVSGRLHAHLAPGLISGQVDHLVRALQRVYEQVGKITFRGNIKAFFEVVDAAYGIKRVTYREGATYMRYSYLLSLARIFSSHEDFWRGNKLMVEASLIRKIGSFPWNDPSVQSLASAGGKANDMLVQLMIEHINSGKRTRRLTPRVALDLSIPEEFEDATDE